MLGLRTLGSLIACLALAATAAPADAQVAPQFGLFQTDPSQNVFRFVGKSAIPAGFFSPDSQTFEGSANFGGDPLVNFQGQDVGNADTVVERTADAAPGPDGSLGEPAPIELRALSLVSVAPIEVRTDRGTVEFWDVRATLSPSRASTGTVRLAQTEANGGTFDSQITVYPVFTFTRLSDGVQRVLDVGALPDGQRPDDPVVGEGTPWRAGCVPPALDIASLNPGFCAGQKPSGGTTLTIEQGAGLQHGIRPASARLEHFGCYAAPSGKGFKVRKVSLTDQFGSRVAKVARGLTLCNPTRKNKEAAVVNKRDHLRCYATNRGRSVRQTVFLRNQFGPFAADVLEPTSLCVPSTKQVSRRGSEPPAGGEFNIDHFQCYRIKPRSSFRSHGLVLRDQFGTWKTRIVTPSQLCVPVRKNKTPVGHPVEHLVCYLAKPGRSLKRAVLIRNQFGREATRTLGAVQVCVPSLKVVREL
jgi:hypothetical protein